MPEENPFQSPKGLEEGRVTNPGVSSDAVPQSIPRPIVVVWFLNLLQMFLMVIFGGPFLGYLCILSPTSLLMASVLLIPRRIVWMIGLGYYSLQLVGLLLVCLARMLGSNANPLSLIPVAVVAAVLWYLIRPETRAYYREDW